MTIKERDEIKWFISVNQVRPRLLCNLYKINREELQQIINEVQKS